MAKLDRLPAGEDKARSVRRMFDAIAPRYDLVNRIMTFGMDVGWRRRVVSSLELAEGSIVLDVACGTGDLCRELGAKGLCPFGFDLSAGMLAAARTDAPLVQADALALPVADGMADGITCGFALRNVADLERLFVEFARVLHAGGRIGVLEVSEPESVVLRAGHRMYFHHIVPLIGGALSDRAAYRYLPRSTAYLPPVAELLGMIERCGFHEIERRPVGLGAAQIIMGTKR